MTTEHKDIDDLKGRFEDGDRPTGDDFARLIDSCHNTRQLTDVTITQALSVQGGLTVDGNINTRDVAADGAKLDSLDSFVRTNSDSWEETDHILAVSSTVETVSSVLSNNIHTLNNTLSTYIDNNVATLDSKIDNNVSTLDSKIDTNQTSITTYVDQNVLTLNNLITDNDQSINTLVNNNHAEINTRVDTIAIDLDAAEDDVQQVITTVATNSASWAVDQHTNTLAGLIDVVAENISHDDVLKYDSNEQKWYPASDLHGEGQHVDTFLELHDTSVSYTGASGEFVKVNTNGTGLTFVAHDTLSWDDTTSVVRSNSANWATHTDVTDLTNTVATNSANWSTHTDITDLTNTVATNSANWAAHTDVTGLTSDLTNVTNTVATNSASWGDHTDITQLTNTVATNSASWAVLDVDGKLVESQIPELSITQTYTVQNSEEVATLNPAEGIQRGDVVIVSSAYDNLIAKQDDPTGVYDQVTKTYSGYSKLARPDAYVTSVNNMYGNVLVSSDDIDDSNNTNKWSTQQEKDSIANLNTNYVNVSGDTLTGDLDTTAKYLSGGVELHNIFSTNNNVIGDQDVTGTVTASGFVGNYSTLSGAQVVTGVTQDVNIGGHVLHIVNGIIVGVTDE